MDKKMAKRIAKELGITDDNFETRKAFLLINEADSANLRELKKLIGPLSQDMFDAFYDHLTSFAETRKILNDDKMIETLKNKQREYFNQMLAGVFDMEYLYTRLSVGYTHVQLNIVPLWYVGAFSKYLHEFSKLVKKVTDDDHARYLRLYRSLEKVCMLDTVLTLESYNYVKYKVQEELERQASTDELTGLFNRRKFDEVIEYEMERSKRYKTPLLLLIIDLDNFKLVNDKFGHGVGDQVLKRFADNVKVQLRGIDFFFRYGGEEFLVLTPNTDIHGGHSLAEKIRISIEHVLFPTVGQVTVSIGIAEYLEGENKEDFFNRADLLLYTAKQRGRNQVCCNSDDLVEKDAQ